LSAEAAGKARYELGQDFLKAGLLDRAEETFHQLAGTQYANKASRALLEIYQREKEWKRAIDAALALQMSGAGASGLAADCAAFSLAAGLTGPREQHGRCDR
jgi:lipopolysaccharide biosynthesis regulator YciM